MPNKIKNTFGYPKNLTQNDNKEITNNKPS